MPRWVGRKMEEVGVAHSSNSSRPWRTYTKENHVFWMIGGKVMNVDSMFIGSCRTWPKKIHRCSATVLEAWCEANVPVAAEALVGEHLRGTSPAGPFSAVRCEAILC